MRTPRVSVFVHTCAFTMMKSDPTHTPSVSGKNSEWEGGGVGGGGLEGVKILLEFIQLSNMSSPALENNWTLPFIPILYIQNYKEFITKMFLIFFSSDFLIFLWERDRRGALC